jgi:hypothetical protein
VPEGGREEVSAEELSAGVFGMPFDMLVHYECMLLKGNGKSGGDTGGWPWAHK